MTDLQKQIELLEQQGNDAELLSLLASNPDTRASNRRAADKFRLLAVELRYRATAVSLSPDVPDALVGDRSINDGVRYRAMAHECLQRPCIDSTSRQGVASSMA